MYQGLLQPTERALRTAVIRSPHSFRTSMNLGIGSRVKLFLLRRSRTTPQPETPTSGGCYDVHRAAREAHHLAVL